ncbi:MAG: SH3 domain-containing protein [Clostridia bacterium]|nr:SH3 domain-containing protein [Clostridia bacterium]
MANEELDIMLELNEEDLEQIAGGKKNQFVKAVEDNAPVRRRPGRDAQVLGRLRKGTVVSFLGETRNTSDGLTWMKINYNGEIAWVSNKYCRFV